VRAWFGLRGREPERPDITPAAAWIDDRLRPGGIALITGASGGGKSSLLRALGARLRRRGRGAIEVDPRRLPAGASVLDSIRGGTVEAVRLLAWAGLGEAPLLVRRPARLSDGERWRLALACAMARAGRRGGGAPADHGLEARATLLIDEFASILDRTTGVNLARTLRRFARRSGVRVVCATAHDDILEPLAPDLLVAIELDGRVRVEERRVTSDERSC